MRLRTSFFVLLFLFCLSAGCTNLLVNPTFEEKEPSGALKGWRPSVTGGSWAGVDDFAYAGERAGKIVKINDGVSHVAALTQFVSAQPNTTYVLSGYAFASKGRAMLFAYEYDENNKAIGNTAGAVAPITESKYYPISVKFTTGPQTVRLLVRFEIYGRDAEGVAWVDNVYLGFDKEPPAAVSDLTAIREAAGVRLTWNPSGDAEGYLIYRGFSSDFVINEGLLIGESTSPDFVDSFPLDFHSTADSPLAGVEPVRYYAVIAIDEALNFSEPAYSQRVAGDLDSEIVGWTLGTRKVLRDEWPSYLRSDPIKIFAARNEYEPFQVVVRSGAEHITGLEVMVSEFVTESGKIGRSNVQVAVTHFMRIEEPMNPTFRAGWYPDALIPIEVADTTIHPDSNLSFFITVYIPSDAKPGIYQSQVILKAEGEILAELPVELVVWPFTLPEENSQQSSFGLWYHQVAPAHGYAQNDPDFMQIAWSYYWFLVEHRLSPREMPVSPFSQDGMIVLQDPRVSSISLPKPWEMADPYSEFGQNISKLRELGLLHKGFVYVMDEPVPEQYPQVLARAQTVYRYGGEDVRVLVTEQPEPELYGEIDIWVPVLSYYDPQRAKARQELGEKIWWYTCVNPKFPYPTYFIDEDAIGTRILSWLQVKYNIDGTLYWSTTVFQKWDGKRYIPRDVWTDSTAFPNTHGDGYLLYPGSRYGIDGPIGTIRLAMIREGNEDLEYFHLLKRLAKEFGLSDAETEGLIEELINPVATNLTQWKREPELLYEQRRKVAEQIICLQGKL